MEYNYEEIHQRWTRTRSNTAQNPTILCKINIVAIRRMGSELWCIKYNLIIYLFNYGNQLSNFHISITHVYNYAWFQQYTRPICLGFYFYSNALSSDINTGNISTHREYERGMRHYNNPVPIVSQHERPLHV